jgi:GxxExxY protein
MTDLKYEELSSRVIGCAIEVHRGLGPGLLESSYEQCLAYELTLAGIAFKVQDDIPVLYKEVKLDCGYRADFLIEGVLLIELKSVAQLMRVHEAQLLTYMRHARVSVGLLINFNVTVLKQGLKRYVL